MRTQGSVAMPMARPSVFVRLTVEQYRRVAIDAAAAGKSAGEVMKNAYFEWASNAPRLLKADKRDVMSTLGHIRQKLNQIAKHLNFGGPGSIRSEWDDLIHELWALRHIIEAQYCRCQTPDDEDNRGDCENKI